MSNQFETEVIENQKALYYRALKLTGNHDDASDIVQETLVKALKNKDKFKEGTNLKAWLYTILRNNHINHYRKNLKYQGHLELSDVQIPAGISKNPHLFDEVMEKINSLDEGKKQPILLYIHGYKYEEIAAILDMHIGTVKTRIFKVRELLKKKYRCTPSN